MGQILSPVLARLGHADHFTPPRMAHWCPACNELHYFACEQPQKNGARWRWDGNREKPTFSPSMHITVGQGSEPAEVCHYFVREGMIQFLSDCTHDMAGQTVPLPPIPADRLRDLSMAERASGGLDENGLLR